jgi:hypothetical protein
MDAPNSTIAKIWICATAAACLAFRYPIISVGFSPRGCCFRHSRSICDRPGRTTEYQTAIGQHSLLCQRRTNAYRALDDGTAGDVVDAAGHDRRIGDIREATVAIPLLTMCFTVLLAAFRLYVDGSGKTSRVGENF